MDNFSVRTFMNYLLRAILFTIILCALVLGIFCLSGTTALKSLFCTITDSKEVIYCGYYNTLPSIERVQSDDNTTKLIVGDSICSQLFNPLREYNDTYCIAGDNRAILLSGQYILISEYLKTHPDATDVYLMLRPHNLASQLDSQTGYMYAVAPFVATDTLNNLDDSTINEMHDIYGSYALNKYFVKLMVNSPMAAKLYLNNLSTYHYVQTEAESGFSELSHQYLRNIITLCDSYDVELHFIAMPLGDTEINRNHVEYLDGLIAESEFADVFDNYCEQALYYAPENFPDGFHFGGGNINLNDVVRDIVEETGELQDLVIP